jgi:hypothetical protein
MAVDVCRMLLDWGISEVEEDNKSTLDPERALRDGLDPGPAYYYATYAYPLAQMRKTKPLSI